MNRTHTTRRRLLAIAPSSRGFGFAVIEEPGTLVDWGVKTIRGDKNAGALAKVNQTISLYHPGVLVMQDYTAKGCRRAKRIRVLGEQIVALAVTQKVKVKLVSQKRVRHAFFADAHGTKHALAQILANMFPEELALRLPPKRRPWMSEDYRMDIFDAVALGLVATQVRGKP